MNWPTNIKDWDTALQLQWAADELWAIAHPEEQDPAPRQFVDAMEEAFHKFAE